MRMLMCLQTLTHYDYPLDFAGSCGCALASSRYPVAALNSLALGTDLSFGASCGSCARVTLMSTVLDPPPPRGTGYNFGLHNSSAPSIVVKVTDQCPWSVTGSPCNATSSSPNAFGSFLHFDLAWPAPSGSSSKSIPSDWFPNHKHDYGVWNATYEFVPCTQWSGWGEGGALGSEPSLGDAGCCPASPPLPGNDRFGLLSYDKADEPSTCPAYKIARGNHPAIVPDTIFTASVSDSKGPPASTTPNPSSSSRQTPSVHRSSVSTSRSGCPVHRHSTISASGDSSARSSFLASSTDQEHCSLPANSPSRPATHLASHTSSASAQHASHPSTRHSACHRRRSSAFDSAVSSAHPTMRSHHLHARGHLGLPPLLAQMDL